MDGAERVEERLRRLALEDHPAFLRMGHVDIGRTREGRSRMAAFEHAAQEGQPRLGRQNVPRYDSVNPLEHRDLHLCIYTVWQEWRLRNDP